MPSGFSQKIGPRSARAVLSPGGAPSESGATVVTASAPVGRTPGTRSRRGVHRPQNHLAWLELQLCLFPEVRS